LTSCGQDEGPEIRRIEQGPVYTFIGDAPVCDVLAFRTTISGLSLRIAGTTEDKFTVFPTSTIAPLIKMNFAALRDFSTVLNLSSVNENSYDQVSLTLAGANLILYDPTSDPPIQTVTGRLSTATPAVPIQPNLTVVKGQVQALRVDFDMLRSIEVDAQGEVTGNLTPMLTATVVTPTDAAGFGFFDDLVGFVTSVSPNPVGNFLGGFTCQLLAGSGPAVSVNLNAQTDMYGAPDLKSLETGRVVEVGAYVDKDGNLVAKTIEVEDRAVVEERRIAFVGYVLPSPTLDASGNVTQFKFYVREEEPDLSREVPLDSVVVVNVSPSTAFQVSSRPTNFANVPFDASAVAAGQELIVHGQYTLTADQPTVVAASSIYLKVQTLQGGLASLVEVASDGRTGAFWFDPCARIQQGAPVLVLTNNDTVFINVFGLGEITPHAPLLVRGLPFYIKNAATYHGVPVPAGTLLVTARQIHQLQ
jgi:hypothetical protein